VAPREPGRMRPTGLPAGDAGPADMGLHRRDGDGKAATGYRRNSPGTTSESRTSRLTSGAMAVRMWIEIHDSLVRNAAGELPAFRSAPAGHHRRKRLLEAVETPPPNGWPGPTPSWSASPYVAPTTFRSRCGWWPASRDCSPALLRQAGRNRRPLHRLCRGWRQAHAQQLIVDLLSIPPQQQGTRHPAHRVRRGGGRWRRGICTPPFQESGGSVRLGSAAGRCGWIGGSSPSCSRICSAMPSVQAQDECPRIHVSAVDGGPHWVLSVQDKRHRNRPTRHRERVFQVFHRLHARRNTPAPGSGLAVCRKVAERHGGKIGWNPSPVPGPPFISQSRKRQWIRKPRRSE